jgi:putative ABC transport system substrate-binding protein
MVSRRSILIGSPLLGSRSWWGSSAAFAAVFPRRVAVLFPSAVAPCAEAVEGLRTGVLGNEVSLDLLDLNKDTFTSDVTVELSRKPSVIVAVGSDALRAALDRPAAATVASIMVSTMTLEADHAAGPQAARLHAAIYLDIPIRTLVAELHRLFPSRPRIGVIRNSSRGDPAAVQIRGQGAEMSSVEVADCSAPDALLPVFLSLRKKVDFVICLPDGVLYNGATARPLIMASLENRLPIVGFSPAFLRAGAAVAIYPDYRGIGYQTADLIRRCLEPGDCACAEGPKKVNVALNAKILRLLGMEFAAASHPEVEVLR